MRSGRLSGCNDLVRRPLAQSNRAHFARLYGVIKSLQRLVLGSFLVVAMALVEVDVVRAKPCQRTVELFGDLRGGEPLIRLVADGIEDFGGDQVFVAGFGRRAQGLAEYAFRFACAVLVRGVEEIDAVIECRVYTGDG